jgi:hypothetical protein
MPQLTAGAVTCFSCLGLKTEELHFKEAACGQPLAFFSAFSQRNSTASAAIYRRGFESMVFTSPGGLCVLKPWF